LSSLRTLAVDDATAFVVDEKGKLAGVFPKVSPEDTVKKVKGALG
jgi:peroxiredoxin